MRRRDDKFPDNGFEAWGGYMNAKILKLEEQFTARGDKEESKLSDIFNGVSIFVNGYTIPSADELKTLMSRHGGVYHTYQRSDDYIIASNLPDTKVKRMSLVKVVKPEWITDSITSNRLLDYRDYLLYKNSRTQPRLNFNKMVKNEGFVEDTKELVDFSVDPKNDLNLEIDSISNQNKPGSPSTDTIPDIPDDIEMLDDGNIIKELQINQKTEIKSDFAKTAVDPNFITEFYNNSRLHHISQLGAMFKQHVNDLRENSNLTFPARATLKDKVLSLNNFMNLSPIFFEKGKIIMHIDMDCFFVSVGLRKRPDLRGKPVGVTHSKGGQSRPKRPGVDRNTEFNLYRQKQAKKLGKATGIPEDEVIFESRVDNIADEDDKYGSMSEIASCSYEARAKGVGNGMFMGAALRLCPDLQTIPYDFEEYKEVAYTLYNTIAQYTLDIEAVSCDEMYVECTELIKEMDISVQDFATVLRDEIKSKTGCPCSTGFGGNRLQARLATKRAKPDGQFFLTADLVEDFIFDIKLKDLPGVGRQTAQKLESLGHETCGSLQSMTLASLKAHFGIKTGAQLFDQCRGRDPNPLTFHTVRKSVSAEVNYGIRFENQDQCEEFLKQLSAEVHSRMKQFKVIGKCITLKLMVRAENAPVETAKFMGHGFCDVINKSTSLSNATNDVEVITKEVLLLCKKQNVDPKEMRGIGIQISKLESLNNKQTKGAMSKFLSSNKSVKIENKPEIENVRNIPKEPDLKPNITTDLPKTRIPTTPNKTKSSTSIEKKSPTMGIKKRGRPPKSSKLQTNNNLIGKFLHGQSPRDPPYRDPMGKEVKEFATPVLTMTVKNEEKPIKREEKPQPEGLLGLPWDRVRELLRAWLESGQAPLPCDINMIAAYMRQMVVNKNIDKLNILLNFLRRRTREMNSKDWIDVYNHVIEQVQNAMIAVYGKRLWIGD